MPILLTNQLDRYTLNESEQLQVYNGIDTCIMHDLLEVLKPQLNPETSEAVYKFERASLGPALAMMKRGCRIDLERRRVLIAEFTEEYTDILFNVFCSGGKSDINKFVGSVISFLSL